MIFVPLYQIYVVWLAWKNATWANPKDEHKIKHWLNGGVHVLVSCLIGWGYGWQYCFSNLLLTRVIFDTAMNLFRHLGLGYVSPAPDSFLDKIEKRFIFWIAAKVHKKRTIISEEDIERIAVYFRLLLLITGVGLLII